MIRSSTTLNTHVGDQDGESIQFVWNSTAPGRVLLWVGAREETFHLDVFKVLAKRAQEFVQAISEEMIE